MFYEGTWFPTMFIEMDRHFWVLVRAGLASTSCGFGQFGTTTLTVYDRDSPQEFPRVYLPLFAPCMHILLRHGKLRCRALGLRGLMPNPMQGCVVSIGRYSLNLFSEKALGLQSKI